MERDKKTLIPPIIEGRAACSDVDPDLFFPTENSNSPRALAQIEDAKVVCNRCPIRPQCLTDAIENDIDAYSVQGGMTRDERREEKVRRTLQR